MLEDKFMARLKDKFNGETEIPLNSALVELAYVRLEKRDILNFIRGSQKMHIRSRKLVIGHRKAI